MLLPSALTCDFSQRRANYRASATLYASPPTSPPGLIVTSTLPTTSATTSLAATCRALQGMLSASTSTICQLPTPPLTNAPTPAAFKLRLRGRANKGGNHDGVSSDHGGSERETPGASASSPRRRVAKRAPRRGVNKRRRESDDEGDEEEIESDDGAREVTATGFEQRDPMPPQQQQQQQRQHDATAPYTPDDDEACNQAPSTPKRLRLAPEIIPLGLERSDFHALQATSADTLNTNNHNHNHNHNDHTTESHHDPLSLWTSEDDRLLVELVLAKLKLSRSDWHDCARTLGRDKASVGRRWKSLMAGGDVGMKRGGARRAKIHGTWK